MKKRLKAHPLMITDRIKPFVFVLVLPLLKGLLQYIIYRRITGILSLEIIAFLVVLAIAVAGWLSYSIVLENKRVVIRSGIFIKQISYINFEQISSFSEKRNPLDFMFGSVTCSLNTEAGRVNKADFMFKLSRADAAFLQNAIYGTEEKEKIRFSPLKIAIWAAATSSAFSGLLIVTPIIYRTGDLIGVAVYTMLLDEINVVSAKFNTYMPPIVNTVTLIFLLAYGIAFLYLFLINLRFTLKIGEKTIKTENGFIFRRKSVFKKTAVNNLCVEQTFLMKITDRCSVFASVGGYGEGRSAKAVVAPCDRRGRILSEFGSVFDCLENKGTALRPLRGKGGLRRFLRLPALAVLVDLFVMCVGVWLFPYFNRLVIFAAIIAFAIIFYWSDLCLFNYNCGKLILGDKICGIGSKGLRTRELYCEKEKIGTLKIRETPSDIRLGTCKVRIVVCSESADDVWIRNISKQALKEELLQTYSVNLFE